VRHWTDEERPFVAAATLLLAAILDEMGDSRAAIRAYDAAFTTFGTDARLLTDHEWLAQAMEDARRRCEWLSKHTPASAPGERFHVVTPVEDVWLDSYDEVSPVVERYLATEGATPEPVRVERDTG
jgi:hypothetical protein